MITESERQAVYEIGAENGVPLSIVRQLMKEESGGDCHAVSHKTAEGYYSRGLFQLYDKPGNINWLLEKFYPSDPAFFSFNDPIQNSMIALAYLSSLHDRFGNWYQALIYYNHGDIRGYSVETKNYALRIINAN